MKEVTRTYLRYVVIELWILLYIYILLLITKYVYNRLNVKNIKNYAVMLRLVSDVFPMLTLCSCPNTIKNIIKVCCV